jgi:hypothetical protein
MADKRVTREACAVIGCANAGDDRHHIGGAGSPLIWLCKPHHGQIHGTIWNADHPALTRAGLAKAKAAGRVGGNPGLRTGDPDAIRKVRAGRDAAHLKQVANSLHIWMPTVQRMRPAHAWGEVVHVLNHTDGQSWTVEQLRRTVRRLVSEGIVEATLLDRAPRIHYNNSGVERLVVAIANANPGKTLQQIASQLEAMHERTPRGGTRWHPSSVKHLLAKASKRSVTPVPEKWGATNHG